MRTFNGKFSGRLRHWQPWLRPTARGLGFGCAALVLLVAGRRLGAADLVGLGLGVVAMLLVGVAVVILRRLHLQRAMRLGRVQVHRELNPARLTSHSAAEVVTRISRPGTARSQFTEWQFTDTIGAALHPFGFGADARHVDILQETVENAGNQELRYPVVGQAVGRWPLGPLTATTLDPFGLLRLQTPVGLPAPVTIWPRTVELPVSGLIPPMRGQFLAGSSLGSPDDAVLRGYVAGDDLRRIHWPTSARRGQLLVREEESSAARAVSVFVDPGLLQSGASPQIASWALELAASIGCSSLADGHATRVVSVGESRYVTGQSEAGELLLEQIVAMPRLDPNEAATTRLATVARLAQTKRGEAIFAVVGALDGPAATPLRALVAGGQPGYAWVLSETAHQGAQTAAALRKAGWHSVVANIEQTQLEAWAALFCPAGEIGAPAGGTTKSAPHRQKTVIEKLHRGVRPQRERVGARR